MNEAFGISAALSRLERGRPLVIVDADEVILRFVAGLDRFLRQQSLYLDLSSYRLHGNVKRLDDQTPILDVEVTALLEEFRRELDWLEPVEGAKEAITELSKSAGIVVLSNITPEQARPRARNLAAHGFEFPIVANSGLKGPAVKHLANHSGAPTWFIDDIPQQLASAAEHAPNVTRIHLVGDARLKPLLPPSSHANLYAENWSAAASFIQGHLRA